MSKKVVMNMMIVFGGGGGWCGACFGRVVVVVMGSSGERHLPNNVKKTVQESSFQKIGERS